MALCAEFPRLVCINDENRQLIGALAAVTCAMTFPGLADFVFALGLEALMYVIYKCVRERVTLRVP